MLRGPQTPGELKGRAERMHAFESLAQVQETLDRLGRARAGGRAGARPGQKEQRYRHLLGADEARPSEPARRPAPRTARRPTSARRSWTTGCRRSSARWPTCKPGGRRAARGAGRLTPNEGGPDHRADRARLGAQRRRGLPEPEPSHFMTPGEGVVVDVEAAGVSFPEVLQTRGEYQVKPELPFVPGSEVAGTVRAASDGAGFEPGDRVAAFCMLGGFAEQAVAPPHLTFALPERLDVAQGAGADPQLPHRLLRAEAARAPGRGRDRARPRRAPAASGTASIQVAKGLGARDDRGRLERREGAGRARRRRRRGGALRRRLEGRGQGALRRRRRRRARPGRRRPLHRQPALAGARAAASWSSASPAARSPRSRSTACC